MLPQLAALRDDTRFLVARRARGFCRCPLRHPGILLLRALPPDDEDLPDLLHRMRLEPVADRLQPHVAGIALAGRGPDLDELVRLQGAVDLGQHLVGEALVADDDDGAELVGFGAQLAALFRRERNHRGSISA